MSDLALSALRNLKIEGLGINYRYYIHWVSTGLKDLWSLYLHVYLNYKHAG
jgi:hypothetical protein